MVKGVLQPGGKLPLHENEHPRGTFDVVEQSGNANELSSFEPKNITLNWMVTLLQWWRTHLFMTFSTDWKDV